MMKMMAATNVNKRNESIGNQAPLATIFRPAAKIAGGQTVKMCA
jgi:hypothetical protein